MEDIAQQADDFAEAFESAFARVQVRVETACAAESDWPAQVAAGIRAALAWAATNPAAAQVLTNEAMAAGRSGFARYDRMIEHFGERLRAGRALRPQRSQLPEMTEKMLVGGVATLIAHRLDLGRQTELPALAPEAIQFVLTPYLGPEEARLVADST